MPQKTKQTPMMVQYQKLKDKYPDAFLFFRLGDFYELFNDDAKRAAQILEITLTSRNKNADDPIPMCGVPYHSSRTYIKILIEHGYKVAIAEQMEDPKLAKGMVERDVIKVITPGTYLDEELGSKENNYVAALSAKNSSFYLAYSDVGTGELKVTHLEKFESVKTEFLQLNTNELIVDDTISQVQIDDLKYLRPFTVSHFNNTEVLADSTILNTIDDAQEAYVLSLLITYINTMQQKQIDHWKMAEHYEVSHFLHMDHFVKKNLELTQSVRTEKRANSLLGFLNKTETAMGQRLLKQWLDRPLISITAINERQDCVDDLIANYFTRMEIKEQLSGVYDLERLVAKIAMGTVNPRELIQLKNSLNKIPEIIRGIETLESTHWQSVLNNMTVLPKVTELIESAISDETKPTLKDGNVIKNGFNDQLDSYRDAMHNGKQWIANLQASEREKTGIKSLKIGYNKVFGYYIEVTKANLKALEEGRYERKQTLTNAERFITPELKEVEAKILEAEEKSLALEYMLFAQVREEVKASQVVLQRIAQVIAEIDVLQSFAEISETNRFVRPTMSQNDRKVEVIDSRHPVVEGVIGRQKFVPNTISMDDKTSIIMITGPNMSGKSTYMRQLGLIVIMAQMGCFVPAKSAHLPIFDQIFTRIGAADNLLAGQSTFMVEMMEANTAIQEATDNSLLLFDELGRGTSTYDGIALAQAILEYIHNHFKAKVLFSTHYHELVELENQLSHLKNIHVSATEENGQLVFLHKVYPGPTDKSYGIHVAKLAGLPNTLIQNAQGILQDLETKAITTDDLHDELENSMSSKQIPTITTKEQEVLTALKALNINDITPREAFRLLDDYIYKLEEE